MLGAMLAIAGCQTTTSTIGTNCIPCSTVGVIKPSRDDTNGTLQQVYEINEIYEEICEEK